ncbi:MAG: PKD domain-containing protein [Acidobacteriota bacterium]|nr:PKD domain-containing protein [Acidobacteriota bacterium]
MRTSFATLFGVIGVALLAGCTVKSAEAPSLAGPSTLAISITMTADKDILTQNGLDEAAITVQALGPNGESRNVNLRAQILVDRVPQDYGTLSTKSLTTPSVIRYRAPAAATTVGGQVAQSVTIAVTPVGSDFQGEVSRTIQISLVPPGIILPTNPNLVPAFTITPTTATERQAFATLSFDASATTNAVGSRCNDACTYSWNFGDGTTGTGMTTTHVYRTVGTFQVALTVTDSRGAQMTSIQTITVLPSTPPTAGFQFSPASVGVNQDAFFNASESRPAAGRTIARYDWNFGDGTTGSGAIVSHRYSSPGNFAVILTVTDDAGSAAQSTPKTVEVTPTGGLTADLTFLPTAPRPGQTVSFNASNSKSDTSTIVSYKFNYGDGSPEEVSTSPTQTHVYAAVGDYVATVVVTDALGRTATKQASVKVAVTP